MPGCTISCGIVGDGPAVLLLHGWPQTSHAWRKVMPLLAKHYTVIAPDLPGFGSSSHPSGGYDKKSVASMVRQLVRLLGHDRIKLVGHDVGGLVAYAYAAQWPDEVTHLALMECGIAGIMRESLANPLQGGSWHYAFNMMPDLPEVLIAGRERAFLRYVFFRDKVGLFHADAISEADLDVYAAGLAHPGGVRSSCEYYRTIPQDAADNAAWVTSPLKFPTQVFGAAQAYGKSWLASMENIAERVDSVLVEDCGHYIPEEQPDILAHHLRRFFAG
jgi:pimeloyl-ACP methyl ester carboxylesterase